MPKYTPEVSERLEGVKRFRLDLNLIHGAARLVDEGAVPATFLDEARAYAGLVDRARQTGARIIARAAAGYSSAAMHQQPPLPEMNVPLGLKAGPGPT